MMDWIKRHPWLTGSLVLVAIILFVIIRRAGSSASASTGTTAAGPSDSLLAAQLAASTQLQGQQTAATVAQNQTNAQLAAVQVKSAADVQMAQLAQTVQLQNIVTGGGVAVQQSADALAAAKAQTGAQVSLADIQTQGAVSLAQIQTSGQVAIAGQAAQVNEDQIAAAEAEQASINATQLGLAQASVVRDVSLAGIGADVQKYTVGKEADVAYTQLTQAGQTQRLGITTAGTVAAKQINADVTVAGYEAGVQKYGITAQQNVDLASLADKYGIDMGVLAGLNAGAYGNPNRAAVASNLIAPGSGGAIAASGNAANASIWDNAFAMIGKIGAGLFGGGSAPLY